MAESDDLKIIVQAFDETQRLLRAHLELSADAAATVARVEELLTGQGIVEAIERTRLRSLREGLLAPVDASKHS